MAEAQYTTAQEFFGKEVSNLDHGIGWSTIGDRQLKGTKRDIGADVKKQQYTTLEYPIGVLGTARYPHFMMIYINENTRVQRDDSEDKNRTVETDSRTSGQSTAAVAAQSVDNVNKLVEKAGITTKLFKSGLAHKRITQAICLPLPPQIKAAYSATYNATDESETMGAIVTALASGDPMEALQAGARSLAPAMLSNLTSLGAKIVKDVPVIGDLAGAGAKAAKEGQTLIKQLLAKDAGSVINKRQEQLFQNMGFRHHSFSWLLVPRSSQESNNIHAIITMLKLNMHPDVDFKHSASMLYVPSEFDIEFRTRDTSNDLQSVISHENTAISRIATCSLTALDVNYTPIGEFISVDGIDDPVAVSLDVTFTELEPLSRPMIGRGF